MNHSVGVGAECATRNGGGGSRSGRRYSYRISPSPGRMSKVAYSPCPSNDPQDIEMSGNCLAIPLSAIQTGNTKGKRWFGSLLFATFRDGILCFLVLYYCVMVSVPCV